MAFRKSLNGACGTSIELGLTLGFELLKKKIPLCARDY